MAKSRVAILLILGGVLCMGAVGYFASSTLNAFRRRMPHLSVSPNIPLGEVKPWADLFLKVPVRNTGSAPLIIHDVYSSCNCTKTYLEKTTISPGEETTLHIEYHTTSGVGRPVKVQVVLKTNDPNRPIAVIEMTGHTLFGACALPSNIRLGDVIRGDIKEGEFLVVTPGYSGPLIIVEMASSVKGLELEAPTSPMDARPMGIDGSFKVVKYRYNAHDEIGEVTGNIQLRLHTKVAKEINVPFYVSVVPTVGLIPKTLVVIASDEGDRGTARQIAGKVLVESPAPIKDVRLKGDSDMLSVRWEGVKGAKSGYLLVEFQEDAAADGHTSGIAVLSVDYGEKTEHVRLPWRVLNLGHKE